MQWVSGAVTTAAESPEPWEPSQAGQCQATLTSPGPCPQQRKIPLFWQTSCGQGASCLLLNGERLLLGQRLDPGTERFNPSRVGWFCRMSQGQLVCPVRTHQWQSLSSTSWWSSLLQVLGIKSPHAAPPEQTDIYLIICSMGPNQRHDSNCTIPRHLGTYHISKGGVAVSTTLCSCVAHTHQHSSFQKICILQKRRQGQLSLCSAASLLFLCSQMQLIFSAKLLNLFPLHPHPQCLSLLDV